VREISRSKLLFLDDERIARCKFATAGPLYAALLCVSLGTTAL
jgi:hypothetical protein